MKALVCVAMTVFFGLIADDAFTQVIEGSATYRERMTLPKGAVFEATLEDVSRADAPALVIATTSVPSPGNPPIAFTLDYDRGKIVDRGRYVVRARILLDGKLLFTSDVATPVVTAGQPNKVSIALRRVGIPAGPVVAPNSPAPAGTSRQESLQGTYWRAVELAGASVPSLPPRREAHLVFQPGGRFSGSDGCNRIMGSYTLKGEGVTFGQAGGTQMACPDTADVERRFRSALKGTSHWRIVGSRLELLGATGEPLAVFERGQPAPPPVSASPLQGTTWQLVKFHGGDGTTLTPDDRTKYTLEFAAGGHLATRVDCNRGTGTWKATGSSQLDLGPLALTRVKCPEGSLHDQIVRQWTFIRSFLIKDGHLVLVLLADGGTYEFEPRASKQ
jgi:putative lipoprotein